MYISDALGSKCSISKMYACSIITCVMCTALGIITGAVLNLCLIVQCRDNLYSIDVAGGCQSN